MNECTNLANSFNLDDKTAKNTALGAAPGGVTVAGVATAVAGAIFWLAIPFIAAGMMLCGGAAGGITNLDQTKTR